MTDRSPSPRRAIRFGVFELDLFPVAGRALFSPAASQITWSPDGQYIVAGRDPRASVGISAGIYLIPARGERPVH